MLVGVATCPILCARSMACRSLMGFQSCSTNTTVSAPVRLRPSPPTWVVSSSTSMDGSLLNLSGRDGKDGQKPEACQRQTQVSVLTWTRWNGAGPQGRCRPASGR